MNTTRKNIADKADFALDWSSRHAVPGVEEAANAVKALLKEKGLPEKAILETEAYKTCLRVWYK